MLTKRSMEPQEVMWLNQSSTLMDPIAAYLAYGTPLSNAKEAKCIKKRVEWFILNNGILYKQSCTRLCYTA